MKIILTAGEDAQGKIHLLYLGPDADHGIKALENPPPGIIRTALFKKPNWDKRRQFPENGKIAAPAPVETTPALSAEVAESTILEETADQPETNEAKTETDKPKRKNRKSE